MTQTYDCVYFNTTITWVYFSVNCILCVFVTKTNLRIAWWATTIAYIIATYSTLGIMPTGWNNINNYFGNKGVVID